ncbi:PREDICTED: uncharacterized protein LOC109161662 [Ipomoea nil]|uniref:uncharacterized protein LOC109161662 n=1 Tax=Ipomoea nil TaxID=35883 RepID=UPI0009018C6D|nr:PREDICTED: uncharacterized protein LOC109161662 [Ipomoea nil]
MSNTPVVDPLQQPPPMVMEQQVYASRTAHGSVGPVIGVLAVIAVLGAIAVMIGRLCSGRRIMGRAHYDFESWVETKCASCIDGRLDPPPRPAAATQGGGAPPPPPPEAEEAPQESKEEGAAPAPAEEEQNHSHGTANS